MNLVTFSYGILITSLGIIGYFATGQVSKTALIPCVFGFPIIALAIATWLKSNLIKQTSIAAAVIALLAFGGTIRGLGGLVTLIMGGEVARPSAAIVQGIMAISSIAYFVYIIGISLSKRNNHEIK